MGSAGLSSWLTFGGSQPFHSLELPPAPGLPCVDVGALVWELPFPPSEGKYHANPPSWCQATFQSDRRHYSSLSSGNATTCVSLPREGQPLPKLMLVWLTGHPGGGGSWAPADAAVVSNGTVVLACTCLAHCWSLKSYQHQKLQVCRVSHSGQRSPTSSRSTEKQPTFSSDILAIFVLLAHDIGIYL